MTLIVSSYHHHVRDEKHLFQWHWFYGAEVIVFN